MNALAAGFDEGHAGVLHRVGFLRALLGIAAVLRPAVADQKKKLRARLLLPELHRGMANRRPHAGGVKRADAAESFRDLCAKIFADIFDDVEFHVIAAMTGKAVDAVAVADGLQRVRHQHDRLSFDVDNAALRPFEQRRGALGA